MSHGDYGGLSNATKPYVITLDIHGLVNWEGGVVRSDFVLPVREGTLADLRALVSQPLYTHDYLQVRADMENRIGDLTRPYPSASVVSLDDNLYRPRQTKAVLSLSRYCGLGNGKREGSVVLGQTARPGARTVGEQLTELEPYRQVIVTDVGCFEGAQMEYTVKLLGGAGHEVVGIVVGILTSVASHRLGRTYGFSTSGIPVIGCHCYGEITDWIEERDFYPGLGGIVVADETGMPVAAPNGIGLPCRRPYLMPFADVRERASLYRPDTELSQFSRRQIERTIALFEILGRNVADRGTAVTFTDLKWLLIKPSFPYSGIRELDELAEPRMPVVEFLRKVLGFVE